MSYVALVLMLAGLFFFLVGVLGVLRLPDFYTRMHAAGKCDSLAAELMLLGIALYNLHDLTFAAILVSLKILMIALFIFVASPTATHAITESALILGVEPWKRKGRKT